MKARTIVILLLLNTAATSGVTVALQRASRSDLEREITLLRDLRDEVCWVNAPAYVKTACEISKRRAAAP